VCGIAGILNPSGEPVDSHLLGAMIRALGHRGPDATAVHAAGPVGLAHARLSTIDVAGGKQPMSSADGSLCLTFNGEIFNYLELREALIRRGHSFATRSDTEVILHLYEEEGADCVRSFNGQWAFGLWDAKARRLFLSRDRLGVRPLFYTTVGNTFIFGSEVKSLLVHPAVSRKIDPIGLDQVFTFWSTLPPRTVFGGISEVPPGHSVVVERGDVRLYPHWRPAYPVTPDPVGRSEREYADQLLALLIDATRIRLRADVPVGAYLSGGLDSSSIAAVIAQLTGARLRTFSVTFEDGEFDERRYQQEVSRSLGAQHEEVHCSSGDIGRVFPEVIWHAERPILRTAPAPLYLLSRLVRQRGFKVVLTGEGADETLGGYDIFKEAKIRRFWARRPGSRLRPLLLRRLYPYLQNVQSQPEAYLRAFFHVGPEELSSPFFSHLPRWELTSRLKTFLSEAVRNDLRGTDPLAQLAAELPADYAQWDPFCQAQYLETAYLLPGYILSSQGDRVAMAHSVEGRFPFLDHRLVEFAATIPTRLKMKALDEKHVLKRAVEGLVPPAVLARPKQPYRAPEGQSFFTARAGRADLEYVDDLLSAERIRRDGLFDPNRVQLLVRKVRSGHAIGVKDNMALVGILSTQLVVDQFVNRFAKRSIGAAA
jgi:asparagine synthase (glutamine-hydrolysing)